MFCPNSINIGSDVCWAEVFLQMTTDIGYSRKLVREFKAVCRRRSHACGAGEVDYASGIAKEVRNEG